MTDNKSAETSVADRILGMRDDLVTLIAALNEAHEFKMAHELQPIVIVLTDFEEEHSIENAAWPPKADPEERGLLWKDGR